jgi:hypothetical protein
MVSHLHAQEPVWPLRHHQRRVVVRQGQKLPSWLHNKEYTMLADGLLMNPYLNRLAFSCFHHTLLAC